MKYRKLIDTDIELSVIGIGTHQFAGGWGKSFLKSDVKQLLDEANNLGINFLDTAPNYGNHLSEKFIGHGLGRKREQWIIATKFGQKLDENDKNINDFTVKNILLQLEKSLKSLKTNYLDIYQFHSGSNDDFKNDDIWEMLNKEVEKGKIRYLGLSIVDSYVKENNLFQIEKIREKNTNIVQVVYNRLNRQPEDSIIPYCIKNNINIIARVPLAKGFLSGKYAVNDIFDSNDVRANYSQESNNQMLMEVEKIKNNEVPDGINMAQWSIAWCLKNNAVKAVIPGIKNIGQLNSNAHASILVS